jgi:hypothetical protein
VYPTEITLWLRFVAALGSVTLGKLTLILHFNSSLSTGVTLISKHRKDHKILKQQQPHKIINKGKKVILGIKNINTSGDNS